jgi:GT2 family glycosyltransferase
MVFCLSPTVYAVIPVFNRRSFTLACLGYLRQQTYHPLRVTVADGGSTDGTVEILRREYPDVVVLEEGRPVWWSGAMRLGIDWALANSRHPEDMLLMMNNDTQISPSYIETLVRVSRETGAAVGALIVDSREPTRILDAGEFIDWREYTFPVKTTIEPGETRCDRVDVLPGRGSLIPLRMIRAAGNVDDRRFPHYVADYEFFSRLRRHGFRLVVTYEARIAAHVGDTGLTPVRGDTTLRRMWSLLFSRRSMCNVIDHWRFIGCCAPQGQRALARRRLLRVSVGMLFLQTRLRYLAVPVRVCCGVYRTIRFTVRGSYYVNEEDVRRCCLDATALVREGILRPWLRDGWYVFAVRRREWWANREELRCLWIRAWNPLRKPVKWLAAQRYRVVVAKASAGKGPSSS